MTVGRFARWGALGLLLWGMRVLAVNNQNTECTESEPDTPGEQAVPSGAGDTESDRMLRAEQAATILGPALEMNDQDWLNGLLHPRGPPPPEVLIASTGAASSSGNFGILQQEVESAPVMAPHPPAVEQHTPQRVSRGRSRSAPRLPTRRPRPSALGRAEALGNSIQSQTHQLTLEQRQSAVEVASCTRSLLTRAGFTHDTISAGAEEARSSFLQSWLLEDRAQQEHGEEEMDPEGSDEEVEE